jgi:adenylate kinase family enzyme
MRKLGFDIILLGAPASGKDTQALLLRRKFDLKPIESGKYWRRLATQKNKIGELLRKTSQRGDPTPVRLMKKFLLDNVSKVKPHTDLIFVGNPRLKPEAQLLVKLLTSKGRDFKAFYLSLPKSEVYTRSYSRKEARADTHYISNRLRYHKLQVSKTIKYFKKIKKMEIIDGNRPVSAVAKSLEKFLNDYKKSRTS